MINQNITENYLTERTQQEPNLLKGPQGESAFNQAATNVNEAQNMVERIRQETLEGNATNSAACQETRQEENRQTPIQGGYQDASVREEMINANNRPYLEKIHREYSNNERNTSSDRQFFVPQEEQTQSRRKSKAVQVDHIEEQYVIR